MSKYLKSYLFFILPFLFCLIIIVSEPDSFWPDVIYMNIALLIIAIGGIAALYVRGLKYFLVPVFVLSGIIPAVIIDLVTDVSTEGWVPFGDYFFSVVITVVMIAPIFLITGIISLCMLFIFKLRRKK